MAQTALRTRPRRFLGLPAKTVTVPFRRADETENRLPAGWFEFGGAAACIGLVYRFADSG